MHAERPLAALLERKKKMETRSKATQIFCSMMRTSDGDMEEFGCWYPSRWNLRIIEPECLISSYQWESAVYLISPFCNTLILDSGGGVPVLPLPCLLLHVHSRLLFKHAFFGLQLGSTWGGTLSLKTTVGPLSPSLGFQMHTETPLTLIFLLWENWVVLPECSIFWQGSVLKFFSFYACVCVFA